MFNRGKTERILDELYSLNQSIRTILWDVTAILKGVKALMLTVDDIVTKVDAQKTVDDSLGVAVDIAVQGLGTLKGQVADLKNQLAGAGLDQTKAQAILDTLDKTQADLSVKKDDLINAAQSSGNP